MSQSAGKAPILIDNLKDKLDKLMEIKGLFEKWSKFRKIDGAPAKNGATPFLKNIIWFRRGLTLE